MNPEGFLTAVSDFLDSLFAYVTFVGVSAAVAVTALYADVLWLALLSGLLALVFVTDLFSMYAWSRLQSHFERVQRNRTPPNRELTPPTVSPTTKAAVTIGTVIFVLYVLLGLVIRLFL